MEIDSNMRAIILIKLDIQWDIHNNHDLTNVEMYQQSSIVGKIYITNITYPLVN